jgi:transcription-repair coupling factor (superfamily II helicase)
MPKAKHQPNRPRVYAGIPESAHLWLCAHIQKELPYPTTLLILPAHLNADAVSSELALFLNTETALTAEILQVQSIQKTTDERTIPTAGLDRLQLLNRLISHRNTPRKPLIVLSTADALIENVPHPDQIQHHEHALCVGTKIAPSELKRLLVEDYDFDQEAVCEYPGQCALRGGLIDIYPLQASEPVRIEFFDDEIESIRTFDPTTQRGTGSLEKVTLHARRVIDLETTTTIPADYLPAKVNWIFIDPVEVLESDTAYQKLYGIQENRKADTLSRIHTLDVPDIEAVPEVRNWETQLPRIPDHLIGSDRSRAEEKRRLILFEKMQAIMAHNCRVSIVASSESEEVRIRELWQSHCSDKAPEFVRGFLMQGFHAFHIPAELASEPQRCFVSENDLFERQRIHIPTTERRRLPQPHTVDQLLHFSDLEIGDHLVHLTQGVCEYRGITRFPEQGDQEYITLEFDDQARIHLPLNEAHLLSRYVGLSKIRPKLAKLGSGGFEKTRQEAEKATLDFAAQLLKLEAIRDATEGYAFSPDGEWQKSFEAAFPYTETRDQLTAIIDTKKDMEKLRPMDRLICGDVGFGKTEVAIRAAFKAAMDGRQVAILVPTTVLAQQHWITFRERMSGYPLTVEMLSRFRKPSETKSILSELENGKIDIVVGTHRLLSSDLRFKDLGLLIIDEEHRFGVRHKEKLKLLKEHVDVLSMSATPIPRTLYMALMGTRALSVIETPPVNRLPIQTHVQSYSADVVKKAIDFEIRRGGQVFYLHNQVHSIERVADRLRTWFPKLKIGVGHGQMKEAVLESVMTQFVNRQYDVLVCTTIIESGLDIPNCNTILIEGADRFGLAQLYQLRGRVGRFNRQAHAYLLLHTHTGVIQQAQKRLSTMKQYTQLGAGYQIALRDLELRGAGNILGSRQSGHIANVGFDLYCQLLRQSISHLKGDPSATRVRAHVSLDFIGQGNTPPRPDSALGYDALRHEDEDTYEGPIEWAHIPVDYINETQLRMDMYRQLALADTHETLTHIESSLQDRFGNIPHPVQLLLKVTRVRIAAELMGIRSVTAEGNRLKCLRASLKKDDYIKVGNRFPRLTRMQPILRLDEIYAFINYPTT